MEQITSTEAAQAGLSSASEQLRHLMALTGIEVDDETDAESLLRIMVRRGWRFDGDVWCRGGQRVRRFSMALARELTLDVRRWLKVNGWLRAPGRGRPLGRASRAEIVHAALLERALLEGEVAEVQA